VIETAAKSKDYYPTSEEMSAAKTMAFAPESVHTLLQTLFPANSCTKVASLGQAITQATRPRVILCPLQLGLGVQLHHFSSKFLIDSF